MAGRYAKAELDFVSILCRNREPLALFKSLYPPLQGIGFYTELIQMMGRDGTDYLLIDSDVKAKAVAITMGLSPEVFNAMVKESVALGVWDKQPWESEHKLTNEDIQKCVSVVMQNRANARESSQERYAKVKEGKAPRKPRTPKAPKPPQDLNKKPYGQFQNVLLTDDEHAKLRERFNSRTESMIENMSEAFKSSRTLERKYTDHYATLLNWERMAQARAQQQGKIPTRGNAGNEPTGIAKHYVE